MIELIHRCLTDDERTDTLVRQAFGLLGDLADSFPNGQIKQLLLQEWIVTELRNKRGLSPEAKKTMRWAKEVRPACNLILDLIVDFNSCRWSNEQPRRYYQDSLPHSPF